MASLSHGRRNLGNARVEPLGSLVAAVSFTHRTPTERQIRWHGAIVVSKQRSTVTPHGEQGGEISLYAGCLCMRAQGSRAAAGQFWRRAGVGGQ